LDNLSRTKGASYAKLSVMNLGAWIVILLGLIAPSSSFAGRLAEFTVGEITPGVFVHQGLIEPMSAKNLGDIANIGFIIGDDCVAVIDTGGSPWIGAALRAAVQAQTEKPVCYVINTHAHPDHVFGNSAFLVLHPTFIAHRNYAQALGARMQTYLERFSQLYNQTLTSNVIVPPDRTVSDTATVDLGNRVLKLTALPTGHTNSDLIVFDPQTSALWAGDALFVRHIPVLDGSIVGWLKVMKRLQQIPAERAVPGHGPASVPWPEATKAQRRYLSVLAAGIRAVIHRGGTIEEAVKTVGYTERNRWLLFDEYHRRNITAAFAELEWE
jgi:quinoprotein relay system zinc metallohydrolase 2